MALPAFVPVCPDEVSNMGLGPIGLLVSGVDALYLSGRGIVDPAVLTELELQRDLAEAKLPATINLGPLPFVVAPHGWGKYRYCLEHPLGRVGITPSRHLPPLRVQPRSEFLHGVGPAEAVSTFEAMVRPLCHGLSFSVARVDLYADLQGFGLGFSDHDRFVCRADVRRTYEQAGAWSGFDFGSRRSGTMCARIYDKTRDVLRTGHDWWFEIWGDAYDEGRAVTRVEFEIGRKALSQFGLESPAQVLGGADGLWCYASSEWLTLRTPSSDTNRTRWPVDPRWTLVQSAGVTAATVSLDRLCDRARAGSLRQLTPGLIGYLVGFAALVGTRDVDDTCGALATHVRNDEIVRRRLFAQRVDERRAEQGRP